MSQGNNSYKKFLSKISKYGVSIKSKYEMTFSGIEDVEFFVTNISVPGIKFETQEINFDGRRVEVPMFYQYDHDFSMTVINDNKGKLYKAFKKYLIEQSGQYIIPSGQYMTVKILGDSNTSGYQIKLNDVRIKSIGSLSFGNSDNEVSTFDVECSCVSCTNLAEEDSSSLKGLVNSLIGGNTFKYM